jgi:sodium/hydrogen exchanger-like protein 6/7
VSSDDSEEEPLPSGYGDRGDVEADAAGPSRQGMVFRDGQWFTNLDERYLLPLFSNSVTARRHHAKKARRQVSARGGSDSASGTPRGGNSLELSRVDDDYPGADAESENGKVKAPAPGRNFR